jgi:lipoate-protein ligase A
MDSFRWFPWTCADGAQNMATDEALLHTAADKGIATLRFYGWSRATLSLGYFQAAADRLRSARLAGLPWVRRPSGGKALVHHHELTYSLALPAGFARDWMPRMHERVILPALNLLGLAGQIRAATETRFLGEFLCFEQQTPADLVCSGHKVAGSAQRKYRRSLLQHGAILLAQSEYAPELPGIKELTGVDLSVQVLQMAILDEFRRDTGWQAREGTWLEEEKEDIRKMVDHQYKTAGWNEKR